MRTSVVMTTYQGARWVRAQLESILAEAPDEILVYDDGSTDGTNEIVLELLRPSALRWHHQVNPERLGTVRSLEQGLCAATGDVILLADQDDLWLAGRRERMCAALADADVVFTDGALIEPDGMPTGGALWSTVQFTPGRQSRFPSDPLEVLLAGNVVTGAAMGFRRSVLEIGLPLPRIGWHDYWLALMAAGTGQRLTADPSPSLLYRIHDDNTAGLPPTSFRGRLRAGSAARSTRTVLYALLQEAAERLDEGEHTQSAALLRANAGHLQQRNELARSRPRRLLPVATMALRGDYRRRGGSWRTALVDLLDRHS